ncbi:MAG: FG-GAP-like repeat-containing protein [Candidatus Azobacteroides sp.]|nr:FG-GAP-like repeat-containing protein [Candidatus Azobacteroides sp.]
MRRKRFYLSVGDLVRKVASGLIVFFLTIAGLQGQSFQPNTDNVFVNPGGSARWDVLSNDELGVNHWSEVTVTIETYPHHAIPGTVDVVPPMNMISYTPVAGFWGKDSLEYSVYVPEPGETKKAWVYIHVTNQPDNIHTDVCTTPPPKQIWGIDYTRTDEQILSPYQVPLTGDIDGDGIIEILVCADPYIAADTYEGIYRPSSRIAIYKSDDLSAPAYNIYTKKPYSWAYHNTYGIVKTQISGKDSVLVVVGESDRYVRAYNYHGELVWESNNTYHSHAESYRYGAPCFADLNQDGIPEIIVCGRVFDSRSGELLCAITEDLSSTLNLSLAIAVDLFGTGEMHLVIGNYIYKPEPDLSALNLVRKIVPTIDPADPDVPSGTTLSPVNGGMVSVVDIDNDGKLDLIIRVLNDSDRYSFVYVADPETGQLKASKYIPNAGACNYPFIGDIDGDGEPEIILIKSLYGSASSDDAENNFAFAYKFKKGNPVLEEFWRLQHQDGSGRTGITLFDFNQDGISELVYRDEKQLRIINGSLKSHITGQDTTVYNLAVYDNISQTGTEYPVIADIDNDGQAEILIVGGIEGDSNFRVKGYLWVFKSEFPDESPWAPARKVWNQYAFNPVNINEDLTVPTHPISPAAEFITKTGKRHRPFNNFLQQATLLNDEGEPFSWAADIAFVFGYPANTVYVPTAGEVEVGLFVVNQGNTNTTSPLYVSVYAVKTDDTYVWLHTEEMDVVIGEGEQRQLDFSFSYTYITDHKGFEVRLNEKEGTFFFDECLTSNNYAKGKMFSPDERIVCEGETEFIDLYPKNVYLYEWYNTSYQPINEGTWYPTSNGGYKIGTNGETLEITKNSDVVETFYILLKDLDGNYLSTDFEKVCVYLTPDSLVWTGSESTDWNNYGNWLDPNEINPLEPVHPTSKIPRKCTNVIIPDGLTVYPDLSVSSTTYYDYPTAECNNITFEHGGEVLRTDSLHYNQAYIHQQLLSNRWYMLSAPLGNLYPGDYYIHNPNPHLDDVYVYAGFFGRSNPQSGNYVEGDWTGTFNTPGVHFTAGNGFAIWVDDKQPDASIHMPFDFYFPKYDSSYLVYSWEGNQLHTHGASREKHHRFVYEDGSRWNRGTGEITLSASASAANVKVIVGNPFMAHWNFSAFQLSNPIKNYYQILDGEG